MFSKEREKFWIFVDSHNSPAPWTRKITRRSEKYLRSPFFCKCFCKTWQVQINNFSISSFEAQILCSKCPKIQFEPHNTSRLHLNTSRSIMYSEIHSFFYRRTEHGSFIARKFSIHRNITRYKSGQLNELRELNFKRQLKQEPSSNIFFLNDYLTASFLFIQLQHASFSSAYLSFLFS
jgi:hypothetical protein